MAKPLYCCYSVGLPEVGFSSVFVRKLQFSVRLVFAWPFFVLCRTKAD